MTSTSTYYLDDTTLLYEIIVSKGLGYLTDDAKKMLLLVADHYMEKKGGSYRNPKDKEDCLQEGKYTLLSKKKWMNFNEKKYSASLPYFTEIFKRGMMSGFNDIVGKKNSTDTSVFISIDAIYSI